MNTNTFFNQAYWFSNTHPSKSQWQKKCQARSQKKRIEKKKAMHFTMLAFPSICHMLPLSDLIKHHTIGVAVMADADMKCTWSAHEAEFLLVSAACLPCDWWLPQGGSGRQATRRNEHIFTWGLSVNPGRINNLHRARHKPRFRLCRMQGPQADALWLIGRCLCPASHHCVPKFSS